MIVRSLVSGILMLGILFHVSAQIIAHRGSSDQAPENTLAAIMLAVEENFTHIEIDLRLSSDDSVMVIHDEYLDRTTNSTGAINEFSYAALKNISAGYPEKFGQSFQDETIPTLHEVLSAVSNRVIICIDLKNVPEFKVLEVLAKYPKSSIILMSYNLDKLIRIRESYPYYTLVWINNLLNYSLVEQAHHAKVDGVSSSFIIPRFLVNEIKKREMFFWAGIVNDPNMYEALTAMGVDGIITNNTKGFAEINPWSQVYSNSAEGYSIVNVTDPHTLLSIELYNLQGKKLETFPGPFHGLNLLRYTNPLPLGYYLLKIEFESKTEGHLVYIFR